MINFKKLKVKDMDTSLNNVLKSFKNERDTYYIFPNDVKFHLDNITEHEDFAANHILSMINSSKSDEELITLTLHPLEIYFLLIHLQRKMNSL